jgi:hypothetical protein
MMLRFASGGPDRRLGEIRLALSDEEVPDLLGVDEPLMPRLQLREFPLELHLRIARKQADATEAEPTAPE